MLQFLYSDQYSVKNVARTVLYTFETFKNRRKGNWPKNVDSDHLGELTQNVVHSGEGPCTIWANDRVTFGPRIII